MAMWDPPADADLARGKPGKPSHARAIRDLSIALAERVPGSPWINGVGFERTFTGFGSILGGGERSLVGIWQVPDGVYKIAVTLVGGGGAGGDGEYATGSGTTPRKWCGGGGGAGAVLQRVLDVLPEQIYSITIGAGGKPLASGNGSETIFGELAVAGGSSGKDGASGVLGGAGGGAFAGLTPTIFGANGNDSIGRIKSGSGARSFFGGGAPGRYDSGPGYDAFVPSPFGGGGVPGAGGGGGYPEQGSFQAKPGGRGANGE